MTTLLCIDTASKRVRRYEPRGNHKFHSPVPELEIMSQPEGFDLVAQLNLFRTTPAAFEVWRPDPTEAA